MFDDDDFDSIDYSEPQEEDLDLYKNIGNFEETRLDFNNPYIPRDSFEE